MKSIAYYPVCLDGNRAPEPFHQVHTMENRGDKVLSQEIRLDCSTAIFQNCKRQQWNRRQITNVVVKPLLKIKG